MATSTYISRVLLPFERRSNSTFSGATHRPDGARFSGKPPCGMSSLILRFPPNFVRQLSNKARRNCSNIGVAQIVTASWSNHQPLSSAAEAKAGDAAAASSAVSTPISAGVNVDNNNDNNNNNNNDDDDDSKKRLGYGNGSASVQFGDVGSVHKPSFLSGDGSLAIHAGERLGRGIVTDAITTPVVNTSAYFFKNTAELIDFKVEAQEATISDILRLCDVAEALCDAEEQWLSHPLFDLPIWEPSPRKLIASLLEE